MAQRFVFHVDVNSAFLSWEAVRRLQEGDELDLRTVPAAVGGDEKSRHGIITAKSIPAKAYGVTTGEPVAQALKKCPDLILVPGDFELYHRCSAAFIAICREYSPVVEQFSIDECFLDMTGIAENEADAVRLADELRERIHNELMFTVNIGVSENKLLAKMASDFKKPDLTHTLWREEIPGKMWPLPASDLLFVGKASAGGLKNLGIRTIGQLAAMPEAVLKAHFGEKSGEYMHRAANGMDDSSVSGVPEKAKGYGNSTTLANDLLSEEEARPVLLRLSESVSRRMRKDNVKGGLVTVTIRYNDFTDRSRQRKLEFYTDGTDIIYKEALRLFSELWDKMTPIRLLGVSCGNLSDGKNEQLSFIDAKEREKQEKLDRMLDSIREKYGKDAVLRTAELKKRENGEG